MLHTELILSAGRSLTPSWANLSAGSRTGTRRLVPPKRARRYRAKAVQANGPLASRISVMGSPAGALQIRTVRSVLPLASRFPSWAIATERRARSAVRRRVFYSTGLVSAATGAWAPSYPVPDRVFWSSGRPTTGTPATPGRHSRGQSQEQQRRQPGYAARLGP